MPKNDQRRLRVAGASSISPVLRYTNVTTITNDECGSVYSIINDNHICIDTSNGHGSCNVSRSETADVTVACLHIVMFFFLLFPGRQRWPAEPSAERRPLHPGRHRLLRLVGRLRGRLSGRIHPRHRILGLDFRPDRHPRLSSPPVPAVPSSSSGQPETTEPVKARSAQYIFQKPFNSTGTRLLFRSFSFHTSKLPVTLHCDARLFN